MLPVFDRDKLLGAVTNAFLIRSPEKVLASYAKKHDEVSLHAIGFVEQAEIFDAVAQRLGHAPPVIDADQFLEAPEAKLKKLCAALDIAFDPAMLHWPKGPKTFDGVWAPHWYNAVWQSTGFENTGSKYVSLESNFKDVADAATRLVDVAEFEHHPGVGVRFLIAYVRAHGTGRVGDVENHQALAPGGLGAD